MTVANHAVRPADEAVRRSVSRVLRFRHYRGRITLAVIAMETAGLIWLGVGAGVVILLPVVALPLLIPFFVLGRTRLPDEEWEGCPHFAGQLAVLDRCIGNHMYFRDRWSHAVDEDRVVRIDARRSSSGVRGSHRLLVAKTRGIILIVTPRSYWLRHGGTVLSGDATDIALDFFSITEKVRRPRDDDEVLGSTWLYTTKRGERDLRYKDNYQRWEVRRHAVELAMGDERWAFILYARATAVVFINALTVTTAQEPELSFADDSSSVSEDDDTVDNEGDGLGLDDEDLEDDEDAFRPWYDVLGVSPSATRAQIKAAYRERLKEYHPDRVAHLGEKLRDLANDEATAINEAYAEARRLGRI